MTEEAAPAPSVGRCFYGFALFILSSTSLLLYILWSFTPSHYLRLIGLGYFSSKYWAIAIPTTFCTLLFLFAAFLYPSINLILTPGPDSVSTICDRYTRRGQAENPPADVEELMKSGIPAIYDLDLRVVNEMMYKQ